MTDPKTLAEQVVRSEDAGGVQRLMSDEQWAKWRHMYKGRIDTALAAINARDKEWHTEVHRLRAEVAELRGERRQTSDTL